MNQEKKKILVTAGLWQGAITTIQSLGRQGHDVYLVDSDPMRSTAKSKYCKKLFVCPPIEPKKEYVDFIIDLLKKEKFDLLVPISDNCSNFLSERKEEIQSLTKMIIPDNELVQIADNKCLTAKYAMEHDILVPPSFILENKEDVEEVSKKDIFPCIVKTPCGSASYGMYIINSKEDFVTFYQQETHLEFYPLVQKVVKGDLYGSTAVCHKGEILNYFMFYVPTKYATGGAAAYARSTTNAKLLEITKDITKKLNWTGFIDFDFLRDEKGDFPLLEINPRLSGCSHFAYKMKIDLPLAYYNLAFHPDVKVEQPEFKDNMLYRITLPVEMLYHVRNPTKILKSWNYILNFYCKTNINWNDPKLTIAQLKEFWWHCKYIFKNKPSENLSAGIPEYNPQEVNK